MPEPEAKKARIKIAVVFDSEPTDGGSYSYQNGLDDLLEFVCQKDSYELLKIYRTKGVWKLRSQDRKSAVVLRYRAGLLTKIHIWALRSLPGRSLLAIFGSRETLFEKRLVKLGVDLIYFASPNLLALGVFRIPMATTVWDLGHRDLPEFPEFSSHGRWDNREMYFRETVPKSVFVSTDSSATTDRLEDLYGLDPKKGFSLGLLPKKRGCECLDNDHFLPKDPFFLYPAQKWAHKNHEVLLASLQILKREGVGLKLVMTGADKGVGNEILSSAKIHGVEASVIDLGFVDDHLLTHLMKTAVCVVMPSYLGPTNIPPLEALLMGKPTVVSTAHRFDSLPKDAPIKFVDASSPGEWAKAVRDCLTAVDFDSTEMKKTLDRHAIEGLTSALSFAASRVERKGQ
jgi:glycosyltransferase involved in cell wall biosynthesis